MKKLCLYLMVVVALSLSKDVSTSQAALVSLFTLDNASADGINDTNAVTAIAGNLAVTSGALDGSYDIDAAVGSHSAALNKGVSSPKNSYFDMKSSALPQPTDAFTTTDGTGTGMWLGTRSTWIKSTDTSGNWVAPIGRGSSLNMGIYYFGGAASFYAKKFQADGTTAVALDGAWHLTTITYQLTTGASGTGSAQFYIDGSPVTTSLSANTLTSGDALGTLSSAALGIDLGPAAGNPPKPGTGIVGNVDDAAVWNNRLSATEVLALYNLGTDPLDYNAQNAQSLFDVFATGTSNTVGGVLWKKVSGLSGSPGTLNAPGGLRYLVLDGNGGGVGQVPEPGTLTLLAAALGLAVVAGRRRK